MTFMQSYPAQHNRVIAWLEATDEDLHSLTPLSDDDSNLARAPSKRKRAMSLPIRPQGDRSPRKRPRTTESGGQSGSPFDSDTPLSLNHTNTFYPSSGPVPSSPQRPSSPLRQTMLYLENASPPIVRQEIWEIDEALPEQVTRLEDWLMRGTDCSFIPQGLELTIKSNRELGANLTKPGDFDRDDTRSAEELSGLWEDVKSIFINAKDCSARMRDENAWCDDVVRPLVHLAMKLYGKNKWWFQNVQSQSIDSQYLSTVSVAGAARPKTLDRKADYVLSHSHRNSEISTLYKKLKAMNNGVIGHTADAFTSHTALFSGFEVKTHVGHILEAQLQMSVWIAASLRKKQELAIKAGFELDDPIVEPVFTIIGKQHSVFYAYLREDNSTGISSVYVIGPDERYPQFSTSSVREVFRLLRLYGNLLEYGADESQEGYWGGFLKPILEKLAGIGHE